MSARAAAFSSMPHSSRVWNVRLSVATTEVGGTVMVWGPLLSSTVTVDAAGAAALDDWAGDCVLPGAGVDGEPQPASARAAPRARAAGARDFFMFICGTSLTLLWVPGVSTARIAPGRQRGVYFVQVSRTAARDRRPT